MKMTYTPEGYPRSPRARRAIRVYRAALARLDKAFRRLQDNPTERRCHAYERAQVIYRRARADYRRWKDNYLTPF
jgi:hypothetical protein